MLWMKGKRKAVAFDLASMGELQFIQPVLLRYSERHPTDLIIIVHVGDTVDAFNQALPSLKQRVKHIRNAMVRRILCSEIDLFLTTEQYDQGLDGVYSVCIFHGHAAKGLTFIPEVIRTFDAFFLLGPVHREAFDCFTKDFLQGKYPEWLRLFNIGYPKSDNLLNGYFSKDEVERRLNLDPSRRTVIYAPAFNEGASLREYGTEIIESIAKETQYNIVVKLPIDCWQPTNNFYATGGIDWFKEIGKLESRFPNLHLCTDYIIDPLLACADVLITCISSVSFEFYALGKPVIFVDTPKYFSGYLKRRFPDQDTLLWASRTTVNGGKEFGLVVADIYELPKAIQTVLDNPSEYPRQQDRLKSYFLYNPGRGAEAAVAKMEELLAARARSDRPVNTLRLLRAVVAEAFTFAQAIRSRIKQRVKSFGLRMLNEHGYTVQRTGGGYIDPQTTIHAARQVGLSICDYLEGRETDSRKRGRRNRIIEKIKPIFASCDTIVEIGAGSGMYMEKVLECAKPKRYEVYETHPRWVQHLKETYGQWYNHGQVVFQAADGETVKDTASGGCRLVHAHGVFVYIPFLQTFSYLEESARVLIPGGYLVFDCYLNRNFMQSDVQAWLQSAWRFPVILPESLLLEFLSHLGFELLNMFEEIHGCSSVTYLVLRKVAGCEAQV
jgi:hypothetical protein